MNRINDTHFKSMAAREERYWWHQNRVRLVRERIQQHTAPHNAASRILDLGCGTGGTVFMLRNVYGYTNVFGADISETAIRLARRFGDWYRQVAPDCGDCVKGHDIVLCLDVLEHIEDDAGFVKNIFREMETGSLFLATVPAMPWLFSEWDRRLGHYRRYGAGRLHRLFEGNGGHIVDLFHIFSYLMPAGIWRRYFSTRKSEEFPAVPVWLNKLLISAGDVERRLIKHLPLPFGLSLMCAAKKR